MFLILFIKIYFFYSKNFIINTKLTKLPNEKDSQSKYYGYGYNKTIITLMVSF